MLFPPAEAMELAGAFQSLQSLSFRLTLQRLIIPVSTLGMSSTQVIFRGAFRWDPVIQSESGFGCHFGLDAVCTIESLASADLLLDPLDCPRCGPGLIFLFQPLLRRPLLSQPLYFPAGVSLLR